ncbi:hypothetical protein PCE1_002750 [Barthelona sp. PCE]
MQYYFDETSGFLLDMSGWPQIDQLEELLEKYSFNNQLCMDHIAALERGDIVNATKVASESENRAVDHYTHRLSEEHFPVDMKFEGRSLEKSIEYWNKVKSDVEKVLSGEHTTTNGEKFTDVIFNGIGGSFLGPLMLILGIYGETYNMALPIRVHFVSNTDPEDLSTLLSRININTTMMVSISKSGGTSETVGNWLAWVELLKVQNLNVGMHCAAITTRNSGLDKQATELGFSFIWHMETETGGRTSIGSAVGMVPAAFAQIDFSDFLRGQSHMDVLTRNPQSKENPAMLIATLIDRLTQTQGNKNMIVLGYSSFLKEFSHYLQQLYMESIGKEYTVSGIRRPTGQTVFGGVGTGEQHAFMQQIQKGISDAFVRFIHFENRTTDFSNEKAGSMGRQLLAFVLGTQAALTQNEKPYISMRFKDRNAMALGMMVALEERIVSFLSVFRDINAYDQPGVQDGKLAAKAINALSMAVVENLNIMEGVVDIAALVEGADIREVDYILTDLYANQKVENSYDDFTKELTRSFNAESGLFVYTVC